jgi:hypothetical protein
MDARQQDPRAAAANGAGQAQAAGAPASTGAPSKGLGLAQLLSIALGIGGLYLLVKVRAEAMSGEDDDTDAHRDSGAHHTEDLAGWGHMFPHPENPPAWVRDENIWERAKDRVRPNWHEYRAPWAVVAHVYEQMGGRTV